MFRYTYNEGIWAQEITFLLTQSGICSKKLPFRILILILGKNFWMFDPKVSRKSQNESRNKNPRSGPTIWRLGASILWGTVFIRKLPMYFCWFVYGSIKYKIKEIFQEYLRKLLQRFLRNFFQETFPEVSAKILKKNRSNIHSGIFFKNSFRNSIKVAPEISQRFLWKKKNTYTVFKDSWF